MKTLVVYFSRKGYVKGLAEAEAARLGADLLELRTKERTGGILGFWWCGRFGMLRRGMALEPYDNDVSAYDKVVVCAPVWVFDICAPAREFLSREAGRIKAADYMLVHFSFPMRYPRALARMDGVLGVRRGRFESVCCMWGRVFARRVFGG